MPGTAPCPSCAEANDAAQRFCGHCGISLWLNCTSCGRVATHATTATQQCASLKGKRIHPHVLRHSCAMSLLQAGVDATVIALWLGHADVRSTTPYIHADMTIKERALALITPLSVAPGRYKPPDAMLAFLEAL